MSSAFAPTPDDATLSRILEVCVKAAKDAGELIKENCGKAAVDTKANDKDLVTEVDKRCQDVIETQLKEALPWIGFLGEENVPAGTAASAAAIKGILEDPSSPDFLAVVDPIDGTTNFVSGLPLSVVSIGVAHKGTVVVAVIHHPSSGETFTAIRGKGAYCNGSAMRVQEKSVKLSQAVFAVGFHSRFDIGQMQAKSVKAFLPQVRGIRCMGSAALHLAWVAAGRLAGFFELDLNAWDLAAGSLLVTEAGGRIADMQGNSFSLLTRDCYATNGKEGVHEAGLAILKAEGTDVAPPEEGGKEAGK